MPAARTFRWGIAALLVFSCAAWGAGLPPCPKGTQRFHDKSGYTCRKLDGGGTPEPAAGTGAATEKDAWAALDKAMVVYHQQSAAYAHSKLEAEAAQNRLNSANCMQFNCPTQDAQGSLASANTRMGNASAAIQKAIDACNAAKGVIEGARQGETPEHWYRQEKPICPDGPGQITAACPKGMHRHFEKCVKD